MPETANTAIMLIRFCVANDHVDTAWTRDGPFRDGFRFAFFGFVFADIAFPGDGGSGRLAA